MTCPGSYGFSTYCHLPAGHDSDHTNGRRTWTDQQAADSSQTILKAMKGHTE